MPTPIESLALALALLLAFGVAAVARNDQVGQGQWCWSLRAARHRLRIRPTARASPPIAARNRAPACKSNEPWTANLMLLVGWQGGFRPARLR